MEDAGLAGVTNMEDFDELFNDNGLEEEINGFGGSSQFAQIPDGGASPFANVPDGEDMVFAPTQEPNVERVRALRLTSDSTCADSSPGFQITVR